MVTEEYLRLAKKLMTVTSYLSGRKAIQVKTAASGPTINFAATAKKPRSIVIGIIGRIKILATKEINDTW